MHRNVASKALALVTSALLISCTEAPQSPIVKFDGPPQLLVNTTANGVRISEIHYDDAGADINETIEVSAPAAADLTGWSLVLYNGSGGAVYRTNSLTGLTATQCGDRKVVVVTYPVDGIQNGSPDGIALVNNTGQLVEFLSYEGTFAGVGGAANGITSTDIGVAENGSQLEGVSLQRTSSANTWVVSLAGGANKFGLCNDNGTPPPSEVASVQVTPATATAEQGATFQFTAKAYNAANQEVTGVSFTWSSSAPAVATVNASGLATGVLVGSSNIIATANGKVGTAVLSVTAPPPPPELPAVRFSEIHYDNFGTDVGEAIEIEGPANTDLTGWSIVLYNGDAPSRNVYSTVTLSGSTNAACTNLPGRGILYVEYPSNGIQNGPDGFALVDRTGNLIEFLSYEGSFTAVDGPAAGKTSKDIVVLQSSAPAGQTLQRKADGSWEGPKAGNIGGCNSGGPITRANLFSFSGRLASDPALPVDFEDQIFATMINPTTGAAIPTTFTWSSETPGIATIDQDGVVHAVSAGTAVLRATAADGSIGRHTLPMHVATASPTAQYGNHLEFGLPTDADASDDFIVTRPQYVASFNGARGIPNWAAYNLEQTHFGAQDRCDCFTYDPQLPNNFTRYTTADYTGAGTFHGYGIDRGHLVRSFDREAGSLDNATTYYFSNIIPQTADNNQGPWALFENFLGGLAQSGNNEVYVVTGASGSNGTIKNEGIITIPSNVWKVALVLPRDRGLNDVTRPEDVQVHAVIMPNVAGIRNNGWEMYKKTVADVEALSGYNLLAALPDHIEAVVEGRTRAPSASAGGPYTIAEGSSLQFNATATDPDNDPLTFTWSFGDGSNGTGNNATHTYTDNGSFTAKLTVNDPAGAQATASALVTVTNVVPTVEAGAAIALRQREIATVVATFADAGVADGPWSYTINWGDGTSSSGTTNAPGQLTGTHAYATVGEFTVTVTVNDKDAGSGSDALVVSVAAAGATPVGANVPVQPIDPTTNAQPVVLTFGNVTAGGQTTVVSSNTAPNAVPPIQSNFRIGSPALFFDISTTAQFSGAVSMCIDFSATSFENGTQPALLHFENGAWTDVTTSVDLANKKICGSVTSFSPFAIVRKNRVPVARAGSYSGSEGAAISFDGGASTDADGDALTYSWSFGDGATATGKTASHTYANDGTYTVTLTVSDGADTHSATASVSVTNAAVVVGAFNGATLLPGETYTATGTFTDAGADAWTGTVDYGDGTGAGALAITGKSFALSHTYVASGEFTVKVVVIDDDTSDDATQTVTVLTLAGGLQQAGVLVDQLVAAGKINRGAANALQVKLDAAAKSLDNGNNGAAANQLEALLNELDAMVRSGRLTDADAAALRTYTRRIIGSAIR